MKEYKVIDGTSFDINTPDIVCQWLNTSRERKQRIRIFYGDTSTGVCWNEEDDTIGTVGRSGGSVKVPLLIHSIRSSGGGVILDRCIIRIDTKDSRGRITTVYRQEGSTFNKFVSTDIGTVYNQSTDTLYARCKNGESGKRLSNFMNGKRWNK